MYLIEAAYHSPPDAFKGFEEGQQHGMTTVPVGLDSEEETRRGASRANSVRFDESAIHGYYGQASRSSSDLPFRTGSGLGSHPLTERSLSHRSDGRLSSSGHSHHSVRTNSLGLETTSRLMGSSYSESSLIDPPPGLFLLGPVPCIIRCWLTTEFTNDSLLYAAICSGSYASSIGMPLLRKLRMHQGLLSEGGRLYIKIPVYLPEASIHGSSSRASSPAPSLPSITIRFIVRDEDVDDSSIQIIVGSDVLRARNADILFSQDKVHMSDDERNRVSVPLVRPERDSIFRPLRSISDTTHPNSQLKSSSNRDSEDAEVTRHSDLPNQSTLATASTRVSMIATDSPVDLRKKQTHPHGAGSVVADHQSTSPPTGSKDGRTTAASKSEQAGVWGPWRRNITQVNNVSNNRPMKILRPTKASTRAASSNYTPTIASAENTDTSAIPHQVSSVSFEENRTGNISARNPVGGASAFNWLNAATGGHRDAPSAR